LVLNVIEPVMKVLKRRHLR